MFWWVLPHCWQSSTSSGLRSDNTGVGSSLFVGGLAVQQLHRVVFTPRGPIGREPMLTELRQRIRDVRRGPDGLLNLLTDANPGCILRIEPVAVPAATDAQ